MRAKIFNDAVAGWLKLRHKLGRSRRCDQDRQPLQMNLQPQPVPQTLDDAAIWLAAIEEQSVVQSQLRTTLTSTPVKSSHESTATPEPSSESSPRQQACVHNAACLPISSKPPIDTYEAVQQHPENLPRSRADASPAVALSGATLPRDGSIHAATFDTPEPASSRIHAAYAPHADCFPAAAERKPTSDGTSQHSERPKSLEYHGDTSTGAMAKLGSMDFEAQLPDGRWVPVKVMIDTGVDRSFLMKPFVDKYDIPHYPLKEGENIGVLTSPLVGGAVTPNKFVHNMHLKWRSAELDFEPFRADLLLSDVGSSDKSEVVAVFGRGLIERRGLLSIVTNWIALERQKPQHASPGILVKRKRDHATKTADAEAWKAEQERFQAHLDQSETSTSNQRDANDTTFSQSETGKPSSATSENALDKNKP